MFRRELIINLLNVPVNHLLTHLLIIGHHFILNYLQFLILFHQCSYFRSLCSNSKIRAFIVNFSEPSRVSALVNLNVISFKVRDIPWLFSFRLSISAITDTTDSVLGLFSNLAMFTYLSLDGVGITISLSKICSLPHYLVYIPHPLSTLSSNSWCTTGRPIFLSKFALPAGLYSTLNPPDKSSH